MDTGEIIKAGITIVTSAGLAISAYRMFLTKYMADREKFEEGRMAFEAHISRELQNARDAFSAQMGETQRTFVAEIRLMNNSLSAIVLAASEDRKTYQAALNVLREERHAEIQSTFNLLDAKLSQRDDKLESHFTHEVGVLRERNHEMANAIGATSTAVRNVAELQGRTEVAVQRLAENMTEAIGKINVSVGRLEERLPAK